MEPDATGLVLETFPEARVERVVEPDEPWREALRAAWRLGRRISLGRNGFDLVFDPPLWGWPLAEFEAVVDHQVEIRDALRCRRDAMAAEKGLR